MKLIDILDATAIPVAYRFSFLTNFWREPLLRRMEREFGLIRPELTVLICLSYEPGANARDICEITEQPSNTVSRAVVSLEEKSYITRSRDTLDSRRIKLKLTAEGQRVHDELMELFSQAEAVMLGGLTEKEVERLTMLLDKIARNAKTWSNDPIFKSPHKAGTEKSKKKLK